MIATRIKLSIGALLVLAGVANATPQIAPSGDPPPRLRLFHLSDRVGRGAVLASLRFVG